MSSQPVPRFDPASYPGPRPRGPVLLHDGEVVDLDVDAWLEGGAGPGVALSDRPPAPVLHQPGEVRFGVAYGSNASPARLRDKGLDVEGAVLLPARLAGYVPAFEARQTGYGAVPLTLVPEPGVVTDTWVLGLPPTATPLLDRTEGRVIDHTPDQVAPEEADGRFAPPGTYQLGRVGAVTVAGRWQLPGALAYLPGRATRVQCGRDGAWRTWPEVDQAGAVAHLVADGPSRPAPLVAEPVWGPWPRTPVVRPRFPVA